MRDQTTKVESNRIPSYEQKQEEIK
jgi:hypothetical protein